VIGGYPPDEEYGLKREDVLAAIEYAANTDTE